MAKVAKGSLEGALGCFEVSHRGQVGFILERSKERGNLGNRPRKDLSFIPVSLAGVTCCTQPEP